MMPGTSTRGVPGTFFSTSPVGLVAPQFWIFFCRSSTTWLIIDDSLTVVAPLEEEVPCAPGAPIGPPPSIGMPFPPPSSIGSEAADPDVLVALAEPVPLADAVFVALP